MNSEQVKQALAPCGLSCEKCFAHADGEIRSHSVVLKEALGNFDVYAKRFETLMDDPVFENYPQFKTMLDLLAAGKCRGCRNEQCMLFKDCGVRPCHQEKRVDFCFQCDEFPCDHTNFDSALHQAWVKVNEIIRKIGIEEYHVLSRARSRYP